MQWEKKKEYAFELSRYFWMLNDSMIKQKQNKMKEVKWNLSLKTVKYLVLSKAAYYVAKDNTLHFRRGL